MPDRVFVPELERHSTTLAVDGPEAHHLRTVRRVAVGAIVELFNGRGLARPAQVLAVERHTVHVLALDAAETTFDDAAGATRPSLSLLVVFPKGDRAAWMIEKLVELGVDAITPLETERTVAHPSDHKRDKLRQRMIEACKQSGRNRLPHLADPLAFRTWLEQPAIGPRWVLDPTGVKLSGAPPDRLTVAIGPEGGFGPLERRHAQEAGCQLVSLPGAILRIETAAEALTAWFRLARP